MRYNDFDEYSYQIMFSHKSLDRARFDNYDDKWKVSTRPHHFHPRNKKNAISS
ncbi:MAG: toxin-antitoxin system TumE family protein [Candidatus Ranarchaeia archaeon]